MLKGERINLKKYLKFFSDKEEHQKKFRISCESYLRLDLSFYAMESPIHLTRHPLPNPSRKTHPVFSLGKQSTGEGILVTATICSPWQAQFLFGLAHLIWFAIGQISERDSSDWPFPILNRFPESLSWADTDRQKMWAAPPINDLTTKSVFHTCISFQNLP